jgi:uncharacterized protein YkwD
MPFRFYNVPEQSLQMPETTYLETQPTTLNSNQFEQTRFRSLSSDPNVGFSDFEQQVVDLTNQERISRGLAPLTINVQLNNAAEQHSQDMVVQNYFSHQGRDGSSPWDRMQSQGYNYSQAAENIAFGQTTAQEVVTDWMNSAGHRQNILDPNLKEIGVGYYNGYWTQDFGTLMA